MFTGLSLDQAPPFEAPLKFFLTAPLLAVCAALGALFLPNLYLHSPNLIASLHLLTIGFMIMIIFGALQQMLPVVAGAVIPRAKLTADITYVLLITGIVSFFLGFILYKNILFFISGTSLLLGISFFTLVSLKELIKVPNKSYIVKGMILSLIFFIFAFLLGVHLLISHATTNIGSLHYTFADLHYNYIFFGFMMLLIISITIQVVPMFWVCEGYKKSDQSIFIYSTTALLFLFTINTFFNLGLDFIYKTLMGICAVYFAFTTIQKLNSRKRKLKDITVYFYTTSMIFLILGIIYWVVMDMFDFNIKTLGVFLGLGFIVSLINGMLYKIVPFLSWFHLSSKGVFDIPTMRDMIPVKKMQLQFYLHLGSVVLFTVSTLIDNGIIFKGALVLFMVSNILFFINIYKAAKIYLDYKKL